METYIVKQICEADFGCEGMPDGSKVQVEVLLCSGDGKELRVTAADKELYAKNINEGDKVYFDTDGSMQKE